MAHERGERAAATVRRRAAGGGRVDAPAKRTAVAMRGAASTARLRRSAPEVVEVARPSPKTVSRPAAKPNSAAGKPRNSARRGAVKKVVGQTRARLTVQRGEARVVKIKELNAQGKCGPGTSVVHLFRVDEVRNGTAAVHLVFFDRHGWYCEHGRSCPAVEDVRKLARPQLARTN